MAYYLIGQVDLHLHILILSDSVSWVGTLKVGSLLLLLSIRIERSVYFGVITNLTT
jgi:hypothetical protein